MAGANDLTMLSFCPIMDRLSSSLGYRRSFESAGTLPFKLNLYRFVLEPLLVTGFTSSYTSAASTAGGGGGGDGGGVRGGVPPISTFRSIYLCAVEKVVATRGCIVSFGSFSSFQLSLLSTAIYCSPSHSSLVVVPFRRRSRLQTPPPSSFHS